MIYKKTAFSLLSIAVFLFMTSCPNPIDPEKLAIQQDLENPGIILSSPKDYDEYATVIMVEGYILDKALENAPAGAELTLSFRIPGTSINGTLPVSLEDGSFSGIIDASSLSSDRVIEFTATDLNGNSSVVLVNIIKPNGGGDISGFTVVPGNKTAALSWDPVPGAESYSVYESKYCQRVSGINATNYTWTGLENGEVYTFEVTAHIPDDTGTDAVSRTITKMPLSTRTFAPWIKAVGDRFITIEWKSNENVSNYIVERRSGEDSEWSQIRTWDKNILRDEKLNYDQSYYYRITPANFQDITSDPADSVPGRFGFNPKSGYNTPGEAYKIALDDNYAYVADDNGGFQIVDISDKSNPKPAGSLTNEVDSVWGVDASGNTAYIVGNNADLSIIDISNRSKPILSRKIDNHNSSHQLILDGDYIYLTNKEVNGASEIFFSRINITDPPTSAGNWSTTPGEYAMGMAIDDRYVYYGTNNGIYILDKNDGSQKAHHYDFELSGVAVSGNHIYMTAKSNGLQIMEPSTDVNGDITLTQMSLLDTPGFACGVAVFGNYAYIADGSYGIHVVDVSDPAAPKILDSYDTPGYARSVSIRGNYLYAADATYGIWIFDLYMAPSPVIASSLPCNINENNGVPSKDISISGTTAYLSCFDYPEINGVAIFNITDYVNPSPIPPGINHYGGVSSSLDVTADRTYVAAGARGLTIHDTSSPASPLPLGTCDTGEWLMGRLRVYGGYAYNTSSSFGLLSMDVSDPAVPVINNNYNLGTSGKHLCVSGNHAFVVDSASGLYIIDISEPTNFSTVANVSIANANSVTTDGDFAYVVTNIGLQLIDISNPQSPLSRGSCNIAGTPSDVEVSGNYAFVSCSGTNSGLEIINLRDKDAPFSIKSCITPGSAEQVEIRGSRAYIADGISGLQIIDLLGE